MLLLNSVAVRYKRNQQRDCVATSRYSSPKKDYVRDDKLCYAMDHAIDYIIAVIMKQTPLCIFVARVHFYGALKRQTSSWEYYLPHSATISTIGPLLRNRLAQSAHSLLGLRSHLDSGTKRRKEHRKERESEIK